MYITFVFQLRNTLVPKSIINGSVHAIVTRKSLLGFHKKSKNNKFDEHCTKTELLLFTNQDNAKSIASIIEKCHQNTVKFTREIDFEEYNNAKISNSLRFDIDKSDYADSMKPLTIEIIPYNYLEKLCLLHYFDMLVADNMNIIRHSNTNYDIYLDCYEYKTFELPNRSVQEKLFRDMLYID